MQNFIRSIYLNSKVISSLNFKKIFISLFSTLLFALISLNYVPLAFAQFNIIGTFHLDNYQEESGSLDGFYTDNGNWSNFSPAFDFNTYCSYPYISNDVIFGNQSYTRLVICDPNLNDCSGNDMISCNQSSFENLGITRPPGNYRALIYLANQNSAWESQEFAFPFSSNAAPSINSISNANLSEGDTYTATGSFTDPDSTSWTGRVDYGDGTGEHAFASPNETIDQANHTFTLSHVYLDNQTNNAPYTVTVKITDNQGATSAPATAQVTVNNVKPSVNAITTSTNPIQVSTQLSASATFTDPGITDTHTAVWDWGDGQTSNGTVTEPNGSTPGSVTGTHTYANANVYTIKLKVTDHPDGEDGNAPDFQYQAVYAPTSSGLFTGVRLFDNPSSATPNTTGKVKFGISVKYDTNNNPTGNVSMNFKNANLDFTATSFDYLVTSGTKAYVKGTGTLNGTSGYTFLASGIDGHDTGGSDEIRFQIKQGTTTIYDSQPNAGDDADPTTSVTGQVIVH